MEPGELLVLVRRRQGLTQAELARRAATSQPVVSAYERRKRDPSVTTLRRLVEAGGERLILRAESPGHALPTASDVAVRGAHLVALLELVEALPKRPRSRFMTAPRLVSR